MTLHHISHMTLCNLIILEPPVLALEEILYVEVNLERPLVSEAFKASTDFAVVLEHCWGTPHNNRDGDMKYYIIKNQCPVKGNKLELSQSSSDSDWSKEPGVPDCSWKL